MPVSLSFPDIDGSGFRMWRPQRYLLYLVAVNGKRGAAKGSRLVRNVSPSYLGIVKQLNGAADLAKSHHLVFPAFRIPQNILLSSAS